MKIELHDFIQTLRHEQKVVVVDYYNGKVYAKGNARRVAFFLEYNEERLRDSKIHLIEIDTFKPTAICIHVRRS